MSGTSFTDADLHAVASLPIAHAVLLRLRAAGAEDHVIAAALDIEVDAVPALAAIALAKLERLRSR